VPTLDLAEVGTLSFEPVDEETFACLRLARDAALAGGTAPCVLNAANEEAVAAFLDGRLGFLDVVATVEAVLAEHDGGPVRDLADVHAAEDRARARARELVAAR
jgi:1-deoxy-D-xylulose-5-phosphate reductoisomerase